jgi:hypothetical protein
MRGSLAHALRTEISPADREVLENFMQSLPNDRHD